MNGVVSLMKVETYWLMSYIDKLVRQLVKPTNISRVGQASLDNRRIKVCDTAMKVHISDGSVKTIFHEHLHFREVCARWMPRKLTFYHRYTSKTPCYQFLSRYCIDGDGLLHHEWWNMVILFHAWKNFIHKLAGPIPERITAVFKSERGIFLCWVGYDRIEMKNSDTFQ